MKPSATLTATAFSMLTPTRLTGIGQHINIGTSFSKLPISYLLSIHHSNLTYFNETPELPTPLDLDQEECLSNVSLLTRTLPFNGTRNPGGGLTQTT